MPASPSLRSSIAAKSRAKRCWREARNLGIEVLAGHSVTDTSGRLRIRSMTVKRNGNGSARKIEVDALLVSAGWTPSVHLFSQSRGKLKFDAANDRFLPDVYAQECICVGTCNGTDDLQSIIDEASAAGADMAKAAGAAGSSSTRLAGVNAFGWTGGMIGAAEGAGRDTSVKAFIDFQHDVCAKDIRLAVREGMHSIEHIKRFTTNGMASDQGKLSNMHGLAIAAEVLGKEIPKVGLTTFRAPYTPVTFGTLINHSRGELFDPTRKTPMHTYEVSQGAEYEDVGNWKRGLVLPEAGRGHAPGGQSRVQDGARRRRRLQRIDARQDRGGRSRCGRVPQPDVHQCLGHAETRQVPLRHHDPRRRLRV